MKTYRYILSALMSVALLSACSEDIIENENPQPNPEAVQTVKLFAEISDVNTRVAYQEDGSGLKVVWEGERTVTNNGKETTIPGDFIFVYPSKGVNDEIDILNEEGYAFELTSGAGTSRGEFTYMGYTVKYQKTTVTEQHVVDVVEGENVIEQHEVEQYTVVKSENKPFPTITAPNGKCQARWEHPLNSAGECQIENDNKEHLKYQEVMTAEISAANISTGDKIEAESEGQPAAVVFTHPKTVVFKIVMNQFLYSIHQGSHVGIVGVDDNEDEVKIDGVYLQRPEKYFAYEQTSEPETYLTVTPTEGDPCNYGAGTETLTTYVMVETSKLQPYKKFIFALTDNWSHDLYIWKLSLPSTASFESGQYYTVDLTERTCLPALNMGGNVLWAVKNLGAQDIYDEGLYYRYGDVNGLTSEQAAAKCNEDNGAFYTKDGYDGTYSPVTNVSGIGTSFENFAQSAIDSHSDQTITIGSTTYNLYTIPEGTEFTSPSDFLRNSGERITMKYDAPENLNNAYDVWVLNTAYDAASVKYGKQWHIPSVVNFSRMRSNCSAIGYNGTKEGFIVKNKNTQHRLFFKSVAIYKTGSTSTAKSSSQTYVRLSNPVLGIKSTQSGSAKILSNSIVIANTVYYNATNIRPVRHPLHTHTHVSTDVITGVTTSGEE